MFPRFINVAVLRHVGSEGGPTMEASGKKCRLRRVAVRREEETMEPGFVPRFACFAFLATVLLASPWPCLPPPLRSPHPRDVHPHPCRLFLLQHLQERHYHALEIEVIFLSKK